MKRNEWNRIKWIRYTRRVQSIYFESNSSFSFFVFLLHVQTIKKEVEDWEGERGRHLGQYWSNRLFSINSVEMVIHWMMLIRSSRSMVQLIGTKDSECEQMKWTNWTNWMNQWMKWRQPNTTTVLNHYLKCIKLYISFPKNQKNQKLPYGI